MPKQILAAFCALVICAPVVPAVCRQAASEPKVTLTVQAMTVAHALEQLATAVHLPLAASPQTANDVICFRFKDVPLGEALKRIAGAVDGTWRVEGDGQRLIRTSDQLRDERSREFAQDVELYRASIQKATEDLQKLPPWTADAAETLARNAEEMLRQFNPSSPDPKWYQRAAGVTEQAPSGRIMRQIAKFLDPKELADLPLFYKTVWSSNPTAMQRPLPHELMPVIEQYCRDQLDWDAVVERHGLKDSPNNLGGYWIGDLFDAKNRSSRKVETVLLTAVKYGPFAGLNLSFAAYDENGNKLSQAQINLADGSIGTGATAKFDSAGSEDQVVPLDESVKSLLALRSRSGSERGQLPDVLRDRLVNPETIDPLALLVSPPLIQIAELKDVDMVACLPDSAFDAAAMGSGGGVRMNQFFQRLGYYQVSSELNGGWLTLKPMRPNQARIWRADRSTLAKYLRRSGSSAPLTLDELAFFALNLPDRTTNSLPEAEASLLGGSGGMVFNQDMLRLYALLSSDQKRRMKERGLPLNSLTQAETECVERMIYGVSSNLQFTPPTTRVDAPAIQRSDWMLFNDGLLLEPTESLPGGVPPQGVLRLKEDLSFAVAMAGQGQEASYSRSQMMNPQTLAWQRFSQERPDLFPWLAQSGQRIDLSNLQYGQRIQLTFTFELTPVLSMTQNLEGRSTPDFQAVTLDTLPDDFKQRFEQAYAEYKRAYANYKPGQTAIPPGSIPPP